MFDDSVKVGSQIELTNDIFYYKGDSTIYTIPTGTIGEITVVYEHDKRNCKGCYIAKFGSVTTVVLSNSFNKIK